MAHKTITIWNIHTNTHIKKNFFDNTWLELFFSIYWDWQFLCGMCMCIFGRHGSLNARDFHALTGLYWLITITVYFSQWPLKKFYFIAFCAQWHSFCKSLGLYIPCYDMTKLLIFQVSIFFLKFHKFTQKFELLWNVCDDTTSWLSFVGEREIFVSHVYKMRRLDKQS